MAQSAFKPGSQTAGGFSEGPMLEVALGLDFFSRGVCGAPRTHPYMARAMIKTRRSKTVLVWVLPAVSAVDEGFAFPEGGVLFEVFEHGAAGFKGGFAVGRPGGQ